MHYLWETHEWEKATEEQVIAALFNPPAFIDPLDMGQIKRLRPVAIRKYQALFYDGNIPIYASNPLRSKK